MTLEETGDLVESQPETMREDKSQTEKYKSMKKFLCSNPKFYKGRRLVKINNKKPNSFALSYSEPPRGKGKVTTQPRRSKTRSINIKPIFRPTIKLGELLNNPKDPCPKGSVCGVYRVPCSCQRVYIGTTRRSINTRLKEHEHSCRLAQPQKSALAEHAHETGHRILFDKTDVLSVCSAYQPRHIREAIEIFKHPNSLNRKEETLAIHPAWHPVLQTAVVDMAVGLLIFLTALAVTYHPLMVSDHTDLATLNRLQQHEELMKKEMGNLQMEFDQKGWSWDPSQVREDWVTTNPTVDDGTWDGWHYVGLIILILFGCCRHTMEKEPSYDSSTDSSSTSTNEDYEDDEDDTDMEPESYGFRQKTLEAFYDHHVEAETSDLSSMCDFVETFVNDLLEACRSALPYHNALLLLENCIGVGSAFEGWHTQKDSKPFSVLVPILPPKGHSFHVEMSDAEDALSKHGHILVEMECMCKRERLLGDVVCFLHHPNHEVRNDQGTFLGHRLCTSSHLDVDKTIHWFQDLVSEAWESISYKYKLDLGLHPSDTTCRLKLMFTSGRSVFIDIILGLQQGDSLVFLTTQGTEKDHLTGTVWQRNFAVQELLFFKWVSQRVPEDSCYLKCLQILIYFKESSPSSRKDSVLTNYHYKTCFMHLLLLLPLSEWEPEDIAPRMQDILLYMHDALQEKYLQHFVIGNISLPIQIPIPQALRSATPLNLFWHIEQDLDLHAKAMREFVEVVDKLRALWSEQEE